MTHGGNGNILLWPFYALQSLNISDVTVEVATAAASEVQRVGIYNSDGVGGLPSTLLFDSGEIAMDTVGITELTGLDIDVPAGLYFYALKLHSSGTSRLSAAYGTNQMYNDTFSAMGAFYGDTQASTVALPATVTVSTSNVTIPSAWIPFLVRGTAL